MVKSGNVKDYDEIDLTGRYQFFSGLPYFIYSSTTEINKDINLTLLRNDEMTMNRVFTDLIYPDSTGQVNYLPLYDTVKFDSITKSPLKDNIPWVRFINKTLGHGLLSIRLAFDNRNIDGKESPLHQPHTKISSGNNDGRYWNRRLIHDNETLVPKGSRYYERNAYLVIEDIKNINEQIAYYVNCLNNPIIISYGLE